MQLILQSNYYTVTLFVENLFRTLGAFLRDAALCFESNCLKYNLFVCTYNKRPKIRTIQESCSDSCLRILSNKSIFLQTSVNIFLSKEKDVMLLQISSQKQPSRGVLKNRCSENMQQIYMRTLMPKCDFNKVGLQLY